MMYREWRTDDNKQFRPIMDDHVDSDQCQMQGPAGRYTCTRPNGHRGTHEAGLSAEETDTGYMPGVHKAVAVWTQV